MLLAHKFRDPLRKPGPDDEIEIGYFFGENFTKFKGIGRTRDWNWQMGSMIQWVGNSSSMIFNDYDSKKHISRIINPDGEQIRSLHRPISAISQNGEFALSYSFVRLQKYAPAYGYASGLEQEVNTPVPMKDGLYIIELQSGEINKLFSVAEIAKIHPEPTMKNAYHYFTHCLFSPSGQRFIFYHRWLSTKGQTWTRMLTSDLSGKDLYIFPTNGIVTHVAWKDENKIFAYASTKEFGSHYYLFRDKTEDFSLFGKDQFTSDGHPQFSSDGKKLITDTYPNRSRIQYLILYDIQRGERVDLAKLRSPFQYRHDVRCDLHPRWNRDATIVCFDSAHTGIRALCTIKL